MADTKVKNFNLRLTEDLHARLRRYVDNYARRHESMNFIINRAIEAELDKLETETKE